MDKTKYIGMDVHKEAISIAVLNFSGKLVSGIRHRNQGQHHSAVFPRTKREPARHFGRRNLGRLVV